MAIFTYTARSKAGAPVSGQVEAADRRAALVQIERLGHIPVSVADRASAAAKPEAPKRRFTLTRPRDRMKTRDVLVFTTELSDLLASGMTLGNALNTLARRGEGRGGTEIIAGLRDEIVRGAGLSEALAQYPKVFPSLYVNMIRAGEASGALAEVLNRLVEHYERMQDLKEKITMALVYPMIVIVMGTGTLVFSMLYVVPKFQVIFEQMRQTLPLPTRILIGTSSWIAKYGWVLLIVIVIGVVLARRGVQSERGRFWWDGVLLKIPLIRGIVAAGVYANFARTLSTLLSNGVPVLRALAIVEQTVGNVVVSRELRNARERVTDGTTISGPLAAGRIFPPLLTDMLAIGEQTGDMSGALTHIGRRYERELDRNVKILTTALEPILIVVVAVMVGFVAISILMAVFNLTNGIGN